MSESYDDPLFEEMGRTVQPLPTAAKTGDIAALRSLIADGQNLDAYENSRTPLMWAAEMGRTEAVRVLLDAGADIDALTISDKKDHNNVEYGWSALMLALLWGRHETARLLLERGADVNFESEGCHTALSLITNRSGKEKPRQEADAEFLPLLRKAGLRIGLREAVLLGDEERLGALLESGADVNAAGRYGVTILMHATQRRNHAAMRMLISRGADLDAQGTVLKSTALIIAAQNKDLKAIELLLAAGADPSIRDRLGRTVSQPFRDA